ncbi:hypothetical protein FNH22_10030 [Fulvivirga sp. M361]|uniref:BatA domain-containing protein n=1 Tax=Fulvivirga sp. M361 TaxID=2594266 RepID=UPI00117A8451|nr:BatA domain-containing protein [Fulvivirga sp. M361]TRX59487.1 hypothetical protein FNH22_10030 [Fulvivirga sp. M361]
MSFLAGEYLFALMGLLVPLVIHLWSKKEGKVIKVGSIRFFPKQETKKSQSIRLHELGLLVLRCLMVIFLVGILVQPLIRTKKNRQKHVILVEGELWADDRFTLIKDSLIRSQGYELRLLQKGFPLAEEDINVQQETIHYWQLLQSARKLEADSISVFAQSRLRAFKGKRPKVPYILQWYTVPGNKTSEFIAEAYHGTDGINVLSVRTSPDVTHIRHYVINEAGTAEVKSKEEGGNHYVKTDGQENWIKANVPVQQRIYIWYDQAFTEDSYFMEAAIKSIEQHLGIAFKVLRQLSSEYQETGPTDLVIWLSQTSYPGGSSKSIVYAHDPVSSMIIQPSLQSEKYYLTNKLSYDVVFQEDLIAHLLPLIFDLYRTDSLITALDKRVATSDQRKAIQQNVDIQGERSQQAGIPYFVWVLFAVLFLAERVLSFMRKQ